MFIGRKNELKLIENELKNPSSAVLVYGKRKIGKTTLIKEATKNINKTVIYFECIKSTYEDNIELFIYYLKRLHVIDESTKFQNLSFIEIFDYLNTLGKNFVVIIDEYSYLKDGDKSKAIDSIFQVIIDNHLTNINLILSGSHISLMKTLLEEKNALFGRFSLQINLKELTYLEASEFYKNKTPYEKAGFYATFGGSPYVLNCIDSNLSLGDNIKNLYLDFKSPVYIYADNFLLSEYTNQLQINKLLLTLQNGRKLYKDLETFIDPKKTGNLSKILKTLIDMDLITKRVPINKKANTNVGRYEINDNVLRFFYTYISKNKSFLVNSNIDAFFEENIEPSLKTFISFRFEQIGHVFISTKVRNGEIKDAVMVGTYYYDDPINHKNGEFDIVIKKKGCYDVIDAKYLDSPLTKYEIIKELEQIKEIKELKIDKIGFVSINGFDKDIPSIDYQFDGNDLYN